MKTIKVNANELVSIVVAAKIWFERQNKIAKELKQTYDFQKELNTASKLKYELTHTTWDIDAELIIDEAPF